MEKAVEFLQYAGRGQGEFVRAVDTHIRLTLALGEIEKALSMMRWRLAAGLSPITTRSHREHTRSWGRCLPWSR
jgi:hypothetical protein